MKSQGEIEAAVCDAVAQFQQEYMGRGPRSVHAHLVENMLFVHLEGVLSAAEQRLIDGNGNGQGNGNGNGSAHGNGRERGVELLKQLRSHLVLAGRSKLDALVHDATGARTINVHHDISAATGEEVIVVTLAAAPACRERKKR
ncbi:MAG: DUF2294 domain-containing protein [Planctomycetota bacterium]|nr:DUF2294 domain-containing protein [Planctomycetota bacterium]